jgi:hypothetical protein
MVNSRFSTSQRESSVNRYTPASDSPGKIAMAERGAQVGRHVVLPPETALTSELQRITRPGFDPSARRAWRRNVIRVLAGHRQVCPIRTTRHRPSSRPARLSATGRSHKARGPDGSTAGQQQQGTYPWPDTDEPGGSDGDDSQPGLDEGRSRRALNDGPMREE